MATRAGQLVYFRRIAEGDSGLMQLRLATDEATFGPGMITFIVTLGFAGFLALRNLRLGRTDSESKRPIWIQSGRQLFCCSWSRSFPVCLILRQRRKV